MRIPAQTRRSLRAKGAHRCGTLDRPTRCVGVGPIRLMGDRSSARTAIGPGLRPRPLCCCQRSLAAPTSRASASRVRELALSTCCGLSIWRKAVVRRARPATGRAASLWPAAFSQETAMKTNESAPRSVRTPWNKGKFVGQKAPLKPKDIWAVRVHLPMEQRAREFALFHLA